MMPPLGAKIFSFSAKQRRFQAAQWRAFFAGAGAGSARRSRLDF
jgi:hypothetical protein